jgi:hypothetical protein
VADLLSGKTALVGTADAAGAVVRCWRITCKGD